MPRRSVADGEKKRVLQLIFSDIRADHTEGGLKIEFRPKPIWEPYMEAVLARQRQGQDTPVPVATSERKTGLEPAMRSRALRPSACGTAGGPFAPRCVKGGLAGRRYGSESCHERIGKALAPRLDKVPVAHRVEELRRPLLPGEQTVPDKDVVAVGTGAGVRDTYADVVYRSFQEKDIGTTSTSCARRFGEDAGALAFSEHGLELGSADAGYSNPCGIERGDHHRLLRKHGQGSGVPRWSRRRTRRGGRACCAHQARSEHQPKHQRSYNHARQVVPFARCPRRRARPAASAGCDAPLVRQDVVEADLVAVLRTLALPPGFARAVDRAVAARLRKFENVQPVSVAALEAQ
jgi:hypothetical protein